MEELLQKVKDKYPYLTDEKIARIFDLGEIQMLEEGQVFVGAGERSEKVALVLKGIMRNYFFNDNAEQVTVVFATEMQAITPYATIFLKKPATETTEAVEQTILFVMNYSDFKKITQEDPLYLRFYVEMLEQIIVNAIERIESFTNTGPEERYRRLIETQGYLLERVPLKYVASYLGITPVSLSRIRKRMAKSRN